jgi:ribose 1,5-bisphosphokinase PhnN
VSLLVYLFGPPGIGTSTLMAALTSRCRMVPVMLPFPRVLLLPPAAQAQRAPLAVQLGCLHGERPGTDCLRYDVAPAVCAWLRTGAVAPLVLAEGERLARMRFFTCATQAGHDVHAIRLVAPWEVLDRRHQARGARHSAAWREARYARTATLALGVQTHGGDDMRLSTLDATLRPPALLAALVHTEPALRVLRGAHG